MPKRSRSPQESPRTRSLQYSAKMSPSLLPKSPLLTSGLTQAAVLPPTHLPPTIHQLPTADFSGSSFDALFSDPEIKFQLEADRNRTNVAPRDVANLLLWAIPTDVPLVESPKWFFLKNRSHITGVLTIYCNGISYDAIMNTGAGVALNTSSSVTAPVASGESEGELEMRWNEDLCHELLFPIRRGLCFAHSNDVATAPLWIPSQNNKLELDLFFRMTSTRGTPSASGSRSEGARAPSGKKSPFEIAKEMANGGAAATPNSASGTPSTGKSPHGTPKLQPRKDCELDELQAMLGDERLLHQYALTMSDHEDVLRDLQYVIVPPVDEAHQWRSPEERSSPPKENGSHHDGMPSMFAFDCEMVVVEGGISALARCTLVQFPLQKVVLDMLVKPTEPIVDYVTRFSGITEEMLSSVSATLPDAQAALLQHIHTNTYVIGHSLENDFKACKLIPRCRIVDTAHLFPHPAGLPYKNALRFLVQQYLKKKIQCGEHDSVEDAIVCAELLALKMKHGPSFGMASRVNVLKTIPLGTSRPALPPPSSRTTSASDDAVEAGDGSMDKLASCEAPLGRPIHLTLVDDAVTLRMISSGAPHSTPVIVNRDEDVTKKTVRALAKHKCSTSDGGVHVVWAHLQDCFVDVTALGDEAAIERAKIQTINQRVMNMVEAASDRTLINIIAANCRPGNGNRLSKAHGMLFSFVKDSRGRPPPTQDGNSGCAQS